MGGKLGAKALSQQSKSLQSEASEGALLAQDAVSGKTTRIYTREHSSDLYNAASQAEVSLKAAKTEPALQPKLRQLTALVTQVSAALKRLGGASKDEQRALGRELISEHAALRKALGDAPSVYALYRFATKLRQYKPLVDACLDRVTASLRAELPDYGRDVAIDASDLPAYANGQRFLSKNGPERETFSDPDASWGHRSAVSTRKGGGFYGFKLHAAVCARTDLPVAWQVETARAHESSLADDLLRRVRERVKPETVALDKGYDVNPVYEAVEQAGALPIIPLRKTPAVKRGEHGTPTCGHGTWTFAGADAKRNASKWRCPTGECEPKSTWIKASRLHPLVPRESKRWGDLYRGRASVERAFGRLKNEYGLKPLRVRGLERVALHADLCILATLAAALARARAVPLAA